MRWGLGALSDNWGLFAKRLVSDLGLAYFRFLLAPGLTKLPFVCLCPLLDIN